MSEKNPWKSGRNFKKGECWLVKENFLQWVGVKGKVCWCECWQIARRCRTFVSHLRPFGCFSDSCRLLSAYRRTVPRTWWPCSRFDHVSTSVLRVRQNDYDSSMEYRVHIIWSLHSMFDLLECVPDKQFVWLNRRQKASSKPNTSSKQPQCIGCDTLNHCNATKQNVCPQTKRYLSAGVLTHSWWIMNWIW